MQLSEKKKPLAQERVS